jgi:hypothetical protein
LNTLMESYFEGRERKVLYAPGKLLKEQGGEAFGA